MSPSLSYVITTRNKLPFLKEVLKRLLPRVERDEEVVVTDGASTDGSAEYLARLRDEGRIASLISEPDAGESHGWNKGLLAARGEIIKLITDDDAFCFDCIGRCKRFMMEQPEVDVLSSNIASIDLSDPTSIVMHPQFERDYVRWQQGDPRPFWFIGLALLLRRRSLALTGLMPVGIHCPDTEFSLRITSMSKLRLAWYTGVLCMRIDNPGSNFRRLNETVRRDSRRVLRFYLEPFRTPPSIPQRVWGRAKAWFAFLRDKALGSDATRPAGPTSPSTLGVDVIAAAFEHCDDALRRFDETASRILVR